MRKILFIAGTRPEAIKVAPVYLEMKRRSGFEPVLCSTGQHADLISQGLDPFNLSPDLSLDTMLAGQSLNQLVGALFLEIGKVLADLKPDAVMVQGDTVSAFVGGWCGFYEQIPVYHIEAGLRSHDLGHPFPEEATRRSISIITHTHFAPTEKARQNLLAEGVAEGSIVVTGNTTIDALYLMTGDNYAPSAPAPDEPRKILVTGHRRENFGEGLRNLCSALLQIAENFPDVEITYAVHPNPQVYDQVRGMLGGVDNIKLVPPLNYANFVKRMKECTFIISDSGGVQEEAPALGKPVLVTRMRTERPEAVELGGNRLVSTEAEIFGAACQLLTNTPVYLRMASAGCPYGDGRAAKRICDFIEGLPVEEFNFQV